MDKHLDQLIWKKNKFPSRLNYVLSLDVYNPPINKHSTWPGPQGPKKLHHLQPSIFRSKLLVSGPWRFNRLEGYEKHHFVYTTPKDSATVPNPILIVGSDGSTAPNWIQHVAHECIRCGDLYESRSHQCWSRSPWYPGRNCILELKRFSLSFFFSVFSLFFLRRVVAWVFF